VTDRAPPDSRLPHIADGTLVPAKEVVLPPVPGLTRPRAANDVAPLPDWTQPQAPARAWRALVPQVDLDGNERAGIRLPDIAVPRGTFTGWNLYAAPYASGELADRDGTFLAFAETPAARQAAGDPRPSLQERCADAAAYGAAVRDCVAALQRDRLLLAEDAEQYARAAAG
jgi:hypothetical protein